MSENKIEVCSVGIENGDECHKTTYTQLKNLSVIESLNPFDIDLLSFRRVVSSELFTICEHCKIFFLHKYECYQTSYFDPYKIHKKKITKSLRNVSLTFSQKINKIPDCEKSIAGQKIFNACRNKMNKYISELGEEIKKKEAATNDSDKAISNLEISVSKH